MAHKLDTVGFVTVYDSADSRNIEQAIKREAGALDMLAICTSVSGGTRWYRLDGPSFVNRSRLLALVRQLQERNKISAVIYPESKD